MSIEQVTRDALALSGAERAMLANQLLASLDDVGDLDQSPAEVEQAWAAEIARRRDLILRGEAESIPWEIARERLRQELHERRAP